MKVKEKLFLLENKTSLETIGINQVPFSATRGQFHQHFMNSFCAKSFCQKITNPNCKQIKAAQKTFIQKKLLIKYG
jgi:hypothetical protein